MESSVLDHGPPLALRAGMTSTNPLLRRALLTVPSLLAAALFTGALAGGCIAQPVASEDEATLDSSITANAAITRAEEWVSAKLHYCQAPNHHHDGDTACSSTCNRTDNAAWDPYRSDCSGLVSWAWGLPAPGRVTGEFAPFQHDITHTISASSLAPGDAVNNSEHVMLFKAWVTPGQVARFIEEPGCSSSTPYAHEFTSSVSISGSSIHVSWNGMTFTAIRYNGISGSSQPPPPPPSGGVSCSVDGVAGDCISTSTCAGKAGHTSTPGHCPGPASIECCTAPPSCKVNGVAGLCMETSACAQLPGHHSTPGYCPGGASEECCTK
jgi:hypothetical protein